MSLVVDPRFPEKMLLRIHANMIQEYGEDVDLDLKNYRSVGYRIHYDDEEVESLSGGKFDKNLTLPISKTPTLVQSCRCDHRIAWNCPVRHVNNPSIVLIFGRCCIKRFFGKDGLKKSCRTCGTAHRNRSSMYCKGCRAICKCCKAFHPDNEVCTKCKSCKGATRRLFGDDCETCFKDRELSKVPSFRSKYGTIREVFADENYITFLLTRDWFKLRPEYDLYHKFN
jgi:hypothetical protein